MTKMSYAHNLRVGMKGLTTSPVTVLKVKDQGRKVSILLPISVCHWRSLSSPTLLLILTPFPFFLSVTTSPPLPPFLRSSLRPLDEVRNYECVY